MRTEGEADRQKDMEKLIVGFRSFVNAPKKDAMVHWHIPVNLIHDSIFHPLTNVVLIENDNCLSIYITMLEQLMFQNKDCKKLVLFIIGGRRGREIGSECRNSVIVSYSINPTMFDRVSKPEPSGHQTANHKAKFSS